MGKAGRRDSVPFDSEAAPEQLSELVRLTASTASRTEICGQGLSLTARALGCASGLLLLSDSPDADPSVAASWGGKPRRSLREAGLKALVASRETPCPAPGDDVPDRIILLLPGDIGPVGALVLDRPSTWDRPACSFSRAAVRAVAAALQAERLMGAGRKQREALARRNVELETLREIGARLQDLEDDEEILQVSLDLLLEKLGLEAGWIFWGDVSRRRLELAACRGVTDEFVRNARDKGLDPCLCEDVFRTGRLQMARNTTDCPRMPDFLSYGAPLTHACIPLKFERGVLGVMNIADRPQQVFTREELHFLETAARQICFAVDKARTTRAERRRNVEAQALSSLAKAIGGSLDPDQVLAAIGEYARELLSADRCVIYLGADPTRVEFAYLSGPPLEGLEYGSTVDLVALGSRALVEALRQQRTMVITDADRDDRVNADLARRWNSASAILVPLSARDRSQGLLVADRQRPSEWRVSEVELAGALGGQAALAIENARLYRESREALLRLGKAQDSMMRSERLAAIGTLASGLAHEVRNPLNSISLQLVLLSRRLAKVNDGPLKSEIDSLVGTTRREIERLDQLVGEFLSLNSVDRLSLKESDPETLIHDVMDLMAPLARDRGVRVSENLTGRLPLIPLDREKMKQVLINLVRNAIEAMPKGGSLELASQVSDGAVVLSVADSGPGIEPSLNVFDFFTTTKAGGTGLGLPIARSIIEAHGGDLTLESRPGRGSTFFVKLKVPVAHRA
jgi:signal transduction histidine kinase